MAVHFKFRSSVAFDSIDLSGRPSISVRDLRTRIAELKKLKICADFDLVLSDADTGQVFENEDFQIPVGARVVIRRVPAGREATNDRDVIASTAGKSGVCVGTPSFSTSENFGIDNFDDFGVDLYPNLDAPNHFYADDVDHFNSAASRKKDVSIRSFEVPNLRGQKIESSDVSEAFSNKVGENFRRESDGEENPKEINSKDNVDLNKKLSEDMRLQLTFNADLPAELRCSLCNSIFKEAVMIPCCQHSFCNTCIALALVKQSSCPKCSSTKCTVKDLLPNLSLRQAIEHFIESQNAINASYNNLPIYAPDGESGIQAKEVSCTVSVRQQEPACQPSTATVIGSNHVISEPACESNFPLKRKEELYIETQGGRGTIPPSKHRKYERNCYMCGSPDHLIRECPHAKTGNAIVSGCIPPYREGYWHGTSFSNVRPYANVYGASPMMPFDPMMLQAPAFGISSCMPPMYGGLSTPYGYMRMGAVPHLIMPGAESGTHAAETMNKQNDERKRTYELQERYHDSDLSEDYYSGGTERSHAQPVQPDKHTSSDDDKHRARRTYSHLKHNNYRQRPSYQGDKFHLVDEKHKEPHIFACGRDQRTHFSEKSNSDLQDVSNDSRRHSGERKNHKHKCSNYSGSDCSWKSHHRNRVPEDEDDEFETHLKRHGYKQYNQLESCLEPESSNDHRKFHKERESSHSSRHSSKIMKTRDELFDNDKREVVKGWEKRERDHRYKECRRIR